VCVLEASTSHHQNAGECAAICRSGAAKIGPRHELAPCATGQYRTESAAHADPRHDPTPDRVPVVPARPPANLDNARPPFLASTLGPVVNVARSVPAPTLPPVAKSLAPEIPGAAANNATGCAGAQWTMSASLLLTKAAENLPRRHGRQRGRFLPSHRAIASHQRRGAPCAPAYWRVPASGGRDAAEFQYAENCGANAMLDWWGLQSTRAGVPAHRHVVPHA